MAAAEECVEPLEYQTWVLKVSIHCEGCKKKVRKVLQSLEGVYKTTVDSQQHKVVVTGNVEANILIKKLLKAGKHAELWPPENKSNDQDVASTLRNGNSSKKSQSKNGNRQSEPSKSLSVPSDVSDKPAAEATAKKESKESSPSPEKEDQGEKTSPNGGSGSKRKTKKPQKENTSSDKANNSSSISNKNGAGAASSTKNKNGGGGGGGGGAATEIEGLQQQEATKKTVTGGSGTAVAPAYNFPVYAAAQMPSYVVSYSSMQPSMSYGGAYYSALPMMQSAYVYSTVPVPASYHACNEDYYDACSVM